MRIVGMDPGVSPAFAFLSGRSCTVMRIPRDGHACNLRSARDALRVHQPDLAVLELVGAMSGQAIGATSHLMTSWGMLQGLCCGMDIPVVLVTPQVWKKKMLEEEGYDMGREAPVGRRKDVQKKSALRWVATNYPAVSLFTKGSGLPDHNIAEAVIMAAWRQRRG